MFEMIPVAGTDRADRNVLVRALLRTLDLSAPGERAHAERVSVYGLAVGDALGLSDDELETLRYAALLHDVGKAKLDQALLSKVGSLSEREVQELRFHAELSVRLVETIDFLQPAIPLIKHHHERWNGSGYPEGLRAEQIPLGARIIGLCEAFDVMTMGAPWRTKETVLRARDELQRGSGLEWDPQVVEAFLQVQPLIQPIGIE